jgi:hypothetical protein
VIMKKHREPTGRECLSKVIKLISAAHAGQSPYTPRAGKPAPPP